MARTSTDCVNPGEIATDDLIGYVEGDAAAAVAQHVDRCPACREQADRYARMNTILSSRFFRQSCPPSLTIGEYAAGMLANEELRTVASHLVDCPHCRRERQEFTAFLAKPEEPVRQPGMAGALRRLFAQPLRPLAPALNGLRGGGESESVTYTADGLHLTISVQRTGRGNHNGIIVGLLQDLPDSATELRAELFSADTLIQTEPVDDLGNFLFSGIPAGSYRVEVTVPSAVVVVEPLDIA